MTISLLKLYNCPFFFYSDDPYLVAHKFLDDNMLSQIYLDQVSL